MDIILAFSSVALLLSVFAFLRERGLRRALERLLHKLLSRWRNHETTRHSATRRDDTRPPGQL
jgi:hypothetical protein